MNRLNKSIYKIQVFFQKLAMSSANKRIIVGIISILLLVGLIVGISYALFEYQTNKSVDNLLTTKVGDLSITFSSNTNTISMENAQPMSDANGLLQTPYTFTVTNNGTGSIGFIIKLNEFYYDTSTHDDTNLHFPENKLKVNVNNGSTSTTNYLTSSYTAVNDTLSSGQSKSYSIRIWIDETAGSEVSGKHYHGRIEITDSFVANNDIVSKIQNNLASNLYTPAGDNDQTFIVGTSGDSNYNPNNYLWYSGKLWRIVALNKTAGTITSVKVTTADLITIIPFNGSTTGSSTTYYNSYAYQWLGEEFYDSLRDPTNYLVTDYSWNATMSSTTNKPLNTTMVTAPVGLLNMYEYATSYTNTTSDNGYLYNGYSWWLITQSTIYMINYVTDTGATSSTSGSNKYGIRPTINIKANIEIVSGTGTNTDPYRLSGDNDQEGSIIDDNLNSRYSGEYVTFSNELYRIVAVENGLTKLIKQDYVKQSGSNVTKAFATNQLYSQSIINGTGYWGGYLNDATSGWYSTLSTANKNIIENGTWYLGTVGSSQTYKLSICATVDPIANGTTLISNCTKTSTTATAKVGLIRMGEMFAVQAVDPANAVLSYTLTPNSTTSMYLFLDDSALTSSVNTTTNYAATPVIYIKSTITLSGGIGTKENPFELNVPIPPPTILDKITTNLSSNLYTPSGDTDQTFIVGIAGDTYKPNNYVWYSGKLWRMVTEVKTGGVVTGIKMTTQDLITAMFRDGSSANGGGGGTGAFLNSFMYQFLNEDFYDSLRNPTNYLITNYTWNATLTTTASKPANTTMITSKVGALNTYEYATSYTNTTAANGYLNAGYQWWLVNAYNASTNGGMVTYNGTYSYSTATSALHAIRPAVILKPDIVVVSGTGTAADPYRLEGDNDTPSSGTLLNTRYSGEYVTFNSEPYRIMNVESNLVKLIKVDYHRSSGTVVTKAFSTNSSYATSLTLANTYWGKFFNGTTTSEWYGTLSAANQNMISSSTWYISGLGASSGVSYKKTICATVTTGTLISTCTRTTTTATAKIGMIRFGEIFAAQSASSYSTASNTRTLTPAYTTNQTYYLNTYSTLVAAAASTAYSARPVFYLNSTVYITGGNGTSTSPFTISM